MAQKSWVSLALLVRMPATSVHVCKQKRVRTRTQAHLLQLERRGIAAGVTCMFRQCVRNEDRRAGVLRQANPGDHSIISSSSACSRAMFRALCFISFERG